MAKKKVDDWKRIEKGRLDALIVKHSDHYQIFFMLNKRKTRYIVDTLKDVRNTKNEYKLRKIETIEVEGEWAKALNYYANN